MKHFVLLIIVAQFSFVTKGQVKILFDATKAQTAGNADWIIDADTYNISYGNGPAVPGGGNESNPQRLPTPFQSNITSSTTETYWTGGLSAWAIECVKKGYQVETLPYNGAITYGNTANPQDLSLYNIFVIDEPNILFTTTEKVALITFVQNGGGLFIISNHTVSDRNNDGQDSPDIWNDLFFNNGIVANPFGISFDLDKFSSYTTNIPILPNDSLLQGVNGTVLQARWNSGTTMTISPSANATVKGVVFRPGANNNGNINVMVSYARYGLGKVVAFGDSSPFDDGTGDVNDILYDGFNDIGGNHKRLILNATDWLAANAIVLSEYPRFNCINQYKSVLLEWNVTAEQNVKNYIVTKSYNGVSFFNLSSFTCNQNKYSFIDNDVNYKGIIYYRLIITGKDQSIKYSAIKTVKRNSSASAFFYPNPAHSILKCNYTNIRKVIIRSMLGEVKLIFNNLNNQQIDINSLTYGTYIIQFTLSDGNSYTQLLNVY